MKKLLLILTVLISAANAFAQGALEFKKKEIHVKNLQADDQPHTEVFTMTNTGNQPVIITRITPMTSLLKADWKREPLAPGKKSEIRITFTPNGSMPDKFNYKIMIYSNAKNSREEIVLSGNLVDNPAKPTLLYKATLDGVKFKTSTIDFGTVYTWQVVSDTTYFINTSQEPVTITPQYKPAHLTVSFRPETVQPGKRGMMITTYDAPKKNDFGYSYESLILTINNTKNYKNRLSVTAKLNEDFSKLTKKELAEAPVATFEKKEANFGEITQGEKADCRFKLTNTGKSPLFIRKTKASCGCTAVALGDKVLQPGQSTDIQTIFNSAGKSGRQYKTVTVITNDPKNPEITLTLNGNVKIK